MVRDELGVLLVHAAATADGERIGFRGEEHAPEVESAAAGDGVGGVGFGPQ